jgi:hypothetical protein
MVQSRGRELLVRKLGLRYFCLDFILLLALIHHSLIHSFTHTLTYSPALITFSLCALLSPFSKLDWTEQDWLEHAASY